MERVKVFVPGHLTGFFEICNGPNLLSTGSRGGGLSINSGMLTEILVKNYDEDVINIKINGKKVNNAIVSKYIVDYFLKQVKPNNYYVEINHTTEFPIGNGFGMSGGGALGISYGLNILLELNKTRNECAQIAHIAEVNSKTGLGDVIAQTFGGVEIRVEPGAPGIGVLENILFIPNLKVVCYTNGKIDTNSIISNKDRINDINKAGNMLVKKLLKSPSISNLMELSFQFAQSSELITDDVLDLLKILHSYGFQNASQIMLGRSIFCIVNENEVDKVKEIINDHTSKGNIFIANIDNQGARIIG